MKAGPQRLWPINRIWVWVQEKKIESETDIKKLIYSVKFYSEFMQILLLNFMV